jgi:hypothetical protein
MSRITLLFLAALALSSCRTIPTPLVDLPTTAIITEVKDEATKIVTQTVEIEKVIDHIITITDGPAKTELVGLRDQVVVLKSDAQRHMKRIVELEDANSAANRMYADEVDKRIKAETLAARRTMQRNVAIIAALILAAILTVGIIIAIKK